MNINIKYEPINKHKSPTNYHKTQLIGKLETPKKKKRSVSWKQKQKEKHVSLLDTCRKMGIGWMTWRIVESFFSTLLVYIDKRIRSLLVTPR